MKISSQAIEELKAIYQEEFGERLSDQEAQEIGTRLLTLFQVIYRPLPSESSPRRDKESGDTPPPGQREEDSRS